MSSKNCNCNDSNAASSNAHTNISAARPVAPTLDPLKRIYPSTAVQQTMRNNASTGETGFQSNAAKQVFNPRLKTLPAPLHSAMASNTVSGAPSIVEMARALKATATNSTAVGQIFEFVYNNIEWLPGWGVQKGALGTLLDGMGDQFDQALLLANLLREAGFVSNIVMGTIRLTEAQYQAWWKVADIWVAQSYCLNTFIPVVTPPTSDGTTYYMDIKHVWVEVVISGTSYVLDSSLKTYSRKAGMTSSALASALGYSQSTFLSNAQSGATVDSEFVQNMNSANIANDLKTFTSNLVSYIKNNAIGSSPAGTATVDDVLGGQTIVPVTLPLSLSTTLPYQAPGDTPIVWPGDVPANYKPTLQVQFPNWTNPNAWDFTYQTTSDKLAATTLTLRYDENLVPHLDLNDETVATGQAQPTDSYTSIYLTVTHPAYDSSNYTHDLQQNYQTTWPWWQQFIRTGGTYLIGNAWGNVGRGQASYHADQLAEAKTTPNACKKQLTEGLSFEWWNWTSQNSKVTDLTNRLTNSITMYNHAVGIVSAFDGDQIGTDLGGISISSTYLDTDATKTPISDTVVGMHGVALEAGSLSQFAGKSPAASTTTVIDRANRTAVATIGGIVTVGNVITITVIDPALSGGSTSKSYTAISGDSLTSIATALADEINADSSLAATGVTAVADGAKVFASSTSVNQTSYTTSTSVGATVTSSIAFEKIYQTTTANWSSGTDVESILLANGYDPTDMTNLYNTWIRPGNTVLIPDHPHQTLGAWKGWGFWAYPSSGAVGIIYGAFNGGAISCAWLCDPLWGLLMSCSKSGDDGGGDGNPGENKNGQQTSNEPIGLFTGDYFYDHTDLAVGSQGLPYGLAFKRSYNSADRNKNESALGRGWTHNLTMTAKVGNSGFLAMGDQFAIQGAATIAELYVATDLLSDASRPIAKLVTATLADKWWVDQIVNNTVVLSNSEGKNVFVKQPDGTYTSPAALAATLTLNSNAYSLVNAQGVTWNFNTSGQIASIVYPEGVTITFTYTNGLLTSVTNGLGRTLTLGYTSDKLTSVSDGTGRSISFTIDSNYNLTVCQDANGKNLTYSYDQPGRMTQWFLPANPTTPMCTNVFDSLSRVKTQSNARNQQWTYYIAGARTQEVDPLGNNLTLYFNRLGSTTRSINALSQETSFQYDTLNRLIRTTLPEGNYTQFVFDLKNNLLSKTFVPKSGSSLSNIVLNFSYDSTWNKVHTAQDGNGNMTTLNYNASTGTLKDIQRPAVDGDVPKVTFFYNNRGQVLSSIDETGIQSQFIYDSSTEKLTSTLLNTNWTATISGAVSAGDVVTLTVIDSGLPGGQKSVTYTIAGGDTLSTIATALKNAINADTDLAGKGIVAYSSRDVISMSTAAGNTTTFVQSTSGGATVTITLAAGLNLTTSFGYDSVGNTTSVTDRNGNQTMFAFDSLRRTTQKTEPSPFGYLTQFGYDDNSNLTSLMRQVTSAPTWQTYTFAYSVTNKKTSATDPLSQSTSRTYDGADRLQTMTDAENRQWQYDYDPLNRIYTVTAPDSVVMDTRAYTTNGLLFQRTDGRGNTTEYSFDGFDRLDKRIFADSTFEKNSSFDENGNVLTYVTRSGSTIGMTWDVLNRLSTRAPQGQPTVTLTYDLAGRVTKRNKSMILGDPSTGDFEYFFDSAGRFYREQYPDGKQVTHQLDSNGNRTRLTWPDGYYTTQVFDQLNRLTDIKLNGSPTSAAVFGYDQLSRRTTLALSNGCSQSYSHELNNDMKSLTHRFAASSATHSFRYSRAGQLIGDNVSDSSFMWIPTESLSTAYGTADSVNKYPSLDAVPFSYDSNKNLTGDGTWTWGYDTENHLLAASKSDVSASFVYDPMHRQAQKTVDATKSLYIYSGWQRIADYDGTSGSLQTRYVYGTGFDEPLIAVGSGGSLTFLHQDRIGSVVATSDSTGAVTNKNLYSPFGEITTLSGTTFGFTGQRYDSELGLCYFKRRYYSPKLGRFLQTDPIGYADGLNLYVYAHNDPANLTDRLGLATGNSNINGWGNDPNASPNCWGNDPYANAYAWGDATSSSDDTRVLSFADLKKLLDDFKDPKLSDSEMPKNDDSLETPGLTDWLNSNADKLDMELLFGNLDLLRRGVATATIHSEGIRTYPDAITDIAGPFTHLEIYKRINQGNIITDDPYAAPALPIGDPADPSIM